MRPGLALVVLGAAACVAIAACGSSSDPGAGSTPDASTVAPAPDSGRADASTGPASDASAPSDVAVAVVDSLPANRDRLLATYLAYLKSAPAQTQSNGLSGGALAGACDLWRKLAPSPQGVFLTLTARLQASKVAKDGHSMLSHVVRLYRIAGGQGATATDPGSCGGAEYNRLILSMDVALHDALVLANMHKGQPDGPGPDIADVPGLSNAFWRDSHDLGGPHAPFDLSDETDNGAPRGQVQFFASTTSAAAKAPLGRTDLTTLVDPLGLEMDQDYDCVHDSNALCDYTTYGALCLPGASMKGTDLYTAKYGSFDPSWQPVDCAGK